MLIVLLNKVLTLHVFAAFFTKVTSLAAVRTKVQSVCCSMTLIISPILVFVTFLSTQAKGFQRILLKLHNAASMFFPQKRVHDISSPSPRNCIGGHNFKGQVHVCLLFWCFIDYETSWSFFTKF